MQVDAPADIGSRGPQSPAPNFLNALLAGAAVLLASFANFLLYHQYPLLRAEIVLVAAVLACAAAAIALLYAASGRLGRSLLEGMLVFVALDLNTDIVWAAVLAGAGIFLLTFLRRLSLLPMLSVLALVVLLTSLIGLADRRAPISSTAGSAAASSAAPAILHLILDEHIGLEGISDPALKREVEAFYRARGFRLFGRAYSRHFHTVNAIPDILNFGGPGASDASRQHVRIGRTAYLSLLARSGYRINIYESEFADFCSDVPAAACTRYWSPSLAPIGEMRLPVSEKARLIAFKFAALSSIAMEVARFYDVRIGQPVLRRFALPPAFLRERELSSSVTALRAFDVLTADLRRARAGNVYFAHILFPHYPYVADSDCTVLPPSRWEYRRSVTPLAGREAAYHRQLRCTLRKLDAALAAFDASPAGRGGIVVVHGDHGSRITRIDPRPDTVGAFADRDLIAGYSTLFAVRAPSIVAGVEGRAVAAPELLGALARNGFRSLDGVRPDIRESRIVLDDRQWRPRQQAALPASWNAEAR